MRELGISGEKRRKRTFISLPGIADRGESAYHNLENTGTRHGERAGKRDDGKAAPKVNENSKLEDLQKSQNVWILSSTATATTDYLSGEGEVRVGGGQSLPSLSHTKMTLEWR